MKRVLGITVMAALALSALGGCTSQPSESQEEKELRAKERRAHEELRKTKNQGKQ